MTLDTSGRATAAVAAAHPSDDGNPSTEVQVERPDLQALEALLADPSSVSSEEAAPACLVTESAEPEAGADAVGPFESPQDISFADEVPEPFTPAARPAAETEPAADDGIGAQPPVAADSPGFHAEHATRRAEPEPLDRTSNAVAADGGSTSDGARAVDPMNASADGDIGEEDPDVEGSGVGDTKVMAVPGGAEPETAVDPAKTEHGEESGGIEDRPSDPVAAASAIDAAASLDEDLLRDIAEAPSVSSDSNASDQGEAACLAPDSRVQESARETGADAPNGRQVEAFLDTASTDAGISGTVDTPEQAFLQPWAPDRKAAQPIGELHADEIPAGPQTAIFTYHDGRATGDDAGLVARLPKSDEAEANTALATCKVPEERNDTSAEASAPSEPAAPGAGTHIARTEIDEPPVASATGEADVAEGDDGGSDTGDTAMRGPVEPGAPGALPVKERLEQGDKDAGDRSDRGSEATALLHDTLLRTIADSPAVSSDSVSSNRACAADLALDPPVRDSGRANDAAAPSARGLGRVLDVESPDPGDPLDAEGHEEMPSQPEAPALDTARSMDKMDRVESPAGTATGTGGETVRDGAKPAVHLPDLSGSAPSGADPGHAEPPLRPIADAVATSANETTELPAADFPGIGPSAAFDASSVAGSDGRFDSGPADAVDARGIAPAGSSASETEVARTAHEHEHFGEHGSNTELPPFPESAHAASDSSRDREDSGESEGTNATEDAVSEDAETGSGEGTVICLPDLTGPAPSRSGSGHVGSNLPWVAGAVSVSSGEPADATGPGFNGIGDVRAPGSASVRERSEPEIPEDVRSEDAGLVAPQGSTDVGANAEPLSPGGLDACGNSLASASSFLERSPSGAGTEIYRPDPGEPTNAAATRDPVSKDAGIEQSAGPVIHLPDRSVPARSGSAPSHDASLLRQIADAVAASSGEPAVSSEQASRGSEGTQAGIPAGEPEVEVTSEPGDRSSDDAGDIALPGWGEVEVFGDPVEDERDEEPDDLPPTDAIGAEASATAAGIVFDDTLLLDLDGVVPASSEDAGEPDPLPETTFDVSLPDAGAASSDVPVAESDAEYEDIALEAASPGPAAALAFATDSETEVALRDGLFDFGSSTSGLGEPQVWQGGLRAAIAALAEGRTAPLVIVDVDGVPYPAGAIHELAAVCEVGTVVVAVGSDVSARPGRELLLSGVSDYLAKPLTAEAVRGVASRALADSIKSRPGGRVASFIGSGGSGATTLAAATALHAASRGCYVSVLDLSRSVAAASLALGVEPVAGLDQLLETSDRAALEPDSLEGVCGRRSDRIEVFAHRWSPEQPAIPSALALDRLLAALRLRSQLVLLDGLDEAKMRFLPSDEVEMRVCVAEPTVGEVPYLSRMMDLLDGNRPLLLLQNHTRSFRRDAGMRALREAELGIEPDVTVPFDSIVPELVDRGWPQGRLPRSLRKPVSALTDRLLASTSGADAAAAPVFARAA